MGNIGTTFNLISAFTQALSQQRTLDRANGMGLWQGAQQASQKVLEQYQQMQAEAAFRQQLQASLGALVNNLALSSGAGLDRQLEQIAGGAGRSAQSMIINALKNQARDFLSSSLNVAPEQLSFEGLAEQLFGADLEVGSQVAVQGAGTEALSTSSSGFSNLVGAAGAAYSAYDLISNWGNQTFASGALDGAAMGAYIGSFVPGPGTLIGGTIGGLLGGLSSFFGGHKHKDQVARDDFRKLLMQGGMIDSDYQLTLADGSKFDIGLDGGHRYQGVDGSSLHAYDVDFSNPLSAQVVSWLNPLLKVITQGSLKLQSDFVGYFTNAALSNSTDINGARANVLKFYQRAGIGPENIAQALMQMQQSGAMSEGELGAYAAALQDLFVQPN